MKIIAKVQLFLQEVVTELKKCTWTTRKELTDSTVVVVASIFVMAMIIGVLDYGLTIVLDKIIR